MSLGNFGDVAPVGEGVSEMRVFYEPGYRVYFIPQGDSIVVLLAGGTKTSQQANIAKALGLRLSVQTTVSPQRRGYVLGHLPTPNLWEASDADDSRSTEDAASAAEKVVVSLQNGGHIIGSAA